MTITNLSNLDFTRGRIICDDLRLVVRQRPKPLLTQGKAVLVDERDSRLTSQKISTIRASEKKTKKPVYLEVVHGIEETVENVFLRNNRRNYWSGMGTILTILPLLVYIVILYGWIIYEQVIMKRFAYFTTTTTVILALLFFLCVAGVIIINQFLSEEVIREGNFTQIAEHDRAIDYYFNDELIHVEATVKVGFIWHYHTPDSKFIKKTNLGTFLAEPTAKRRKLISEIQRKKNNVMKLYKHKKEQESKVKTLEVQKNAKIKRKEKITNQFAEQVDAEAQKLDKLINDYNIEVSKLRELVLTTQAQITVLTNEATVEWKEAFDKMIEENALDFDKAEILRLGEFATEQQHEKEAINLRFMTMKEQLSAMRKQSADSTRAATDIALVGTPESQKMALLEEKAKVRYESERKPVDWFSLLKISLPMIIALFIVIILRSFTSFIGDISKTQALIWVIGVIIALAIIGSVLIAIFNQIPSKPATSRLEVKT